jgi:calcineurin-like phosphoesterase family protein
VRRLVTSDLQLQDGPRDRYRTDFVVKTLPELISKYKADQLLVLGDICEKKDFHPAPLVNEIVSCFSDLSQKCQIIILQGNHDHVHKTAPYFEFLSCFENIYWISVPTVRDDCLFLPHTREYKKDWKGVNFSGHDFIFSHNIFDGVKANGQKLSGIPLSVFPDDAFVISGDVHHPQSLGVVTYVGSPCLCDHGDDYQPRVLLLDGLDVKSIKVYGQQKRLIWCSVNKIAGVRELAFDHDANANDIVKIKVELTMEDVAQWPEIRQEVEQWAIKNKFVVNSIVPEVEYVVGERAQVIQGDKKTDIQYLDAFVKRSGADEKTAAIGQEIIDLA